MGSTNALTFYECDEHYAVCHEVRLPIVCAMIHLVGCTSTLNIGEFVFQSSFNLKINGSGSQI